MQVIPHRSVDEVRELVLRRVIDRLRPLTELQSANSMVHESQLRELATKLILRVAGASFRLGGFLPWSGNFKRLSRVYQLALLILNTAFAGLALQRGVTGSSPRSFAASDCVFIVGSAVGLTLLGVWGGSERLQTCLAELERFSQRNFSSEVKFANMTDAVVTFVLWLLFGGFRVCFFLLGIGEDATSWQPIEALHLAGVLFAGAELLTLTLVLLWVTRYMGGMVDSVCSHFMEHFDFRATIVHWNVTQATLRMSSRAIQRGFATLILTLVSAVLALVWDMVTPQSRGWGIPSNLILVGGIFRIMLHAAAVTDACIRVPQLINSSMTSKDEMNADRMYLVQHIEASASGVYIFNVRFSFGTTIRVLHGTALVAVSLARFFVGAQPV